MKREHKAEMKARARNICLKVAYDGTAYHGFQRQTPPIIAVQNVLEEKLQTVCGDTIELAAAGRTDAGVHARGQVVNFFTDGTIPVDRIVRALNSLLPPDIVALSAAEADRGFSARHSARAKTYLYHIQQGEVPDPFSQRYAWHVRQPLDLAAVQEAMQLLEGEHDFSSFRASGGAPMSPVRMMYEAECREKAAGIVELRFYGNGFLYHMVRNLVGSLVKVGIGAWTLPHFAAVLAARDRTQAAATAPAAGLCLYKVDYDGRAGTLCRG
jgi:tRNA pseudouridine38-40 synthase